MAVSSSIVSGVYFVRVSPIYQLIAGDLFRQKAVPRLIVVGRFNDVVAIVPHPLRDIRFDRLEVLRLSVDVTSGIQPMPSPALAVLRRCEKTIDQPFISSGFVSLRKAAASSGVGGIPRRSKYARRRSVFADASGDIVSPLDSSLLSTNASIGVRTRFAAFTLRNRRGDRFAERPELAVFGADIRRLCFCELALSWIRETRRDRRIVLCRSISESPGFGLR